MRNLVFAALWARAAKVAAISMIGFPAPRHCAAKEAVRLKCLGDHFGLILVSDLPCGLVASKHVEDISITVFGTLENLDLSDGFGGKVSH